MLVAQGETEHDREAWVGFRDNVGLAWLKLLKPGFRHCFVLLHQADGWLVCDPLANHTRLYFVAGGFEILDELDMQGCRLLPVRLPVPPSSALAWRPYSCVEAVKRALGIEAPWVLTPWQLYLWLKAAKIISQLNEKCLDAGKKA